MSFTALRDMAEQKLSALPQFSTVIAGSLAAEVEAAGLVVRVYVRRGVLAGKIDANAGAPEFERTLTLAIDLIRAGKSDQVERDLDADVDRVLGTLLADVDFLQDIEGVNGVTVDYDPRDRSEHYAIDARIEIEFVDSVRFDPVIPDDLHTVDVLTTGDTPKPAARFENLQD